MFLVQWPSQDFKGDLDIDYKWVFISFYVNTGIRGIKKSQTWPSQVLGNFSYDELKTPHQTRRQKTFKK